MKIYVVLFAHSIIAFIGGFILLLNIYNGVLDVKFVLASLALTSMFIPLIAYTYVDKKIKKEDKRITAISIWVLIIVIFFTAPIWHQCLTMQA